MKWKLALVERKILGSIYYVKRKENETDFKFYKNVQIHEAFGYLYKAKR